VRPTRIKLFRLIVVSLFSVFVLLAAAAFLVIAFYPEKNLLENISTMAEGATGRKITIGHLNYGIRGVTLDRVSVYDGTGEKDPVIFTADEVSLMFSIRGLLLDRKLKVKRISLKNPSFTIEYDDKGVSNIERIIDSIKSRSGGTGPGASIERIYLANARISLRDSIPVLRPLEGQYTATAEVTIGDDKAVRVSNCSLRLPGTRGLLNPEVEITVKDSNFKIFGDVKLHNASLLWVYMWGTNVTIPYDLINGTVTDLEITKDHVSGHAVATSTLRNSPRIVSADGKCFVNINKETVLLSGIKGGLNGSTFILQNLLFTFNGDIIHFGVTDMDVRVDDVRPLLPFLPEKLSGKVRGSISLAGGRYNSDMDLAGVSFDARNRLVTDLNARLSLRNNLYRIKDIPVRILDSPCTLSVANTDPGMKKIFVEISAEKMVLDEGMLAVSSTNEPVKVPIEVNGRIRIDDLVFNTVKLRKLDLNFTIHESAIDLHGFSTQFTGGAIRGKGSIDLDKMPPHASVSFQFDGIRIQNMDIVKEKLNERVFGLGRGKGQLNFNLDRTMTKSLGGRLEMQIDRGKLVDTGIQNGLGIFLSELKYKLNNLEFNTIYGNLTLEGDRVRANSIIFNSENVRLKVEGDFDKKLVARPLMINLEFNRHFIQDLPGPIALGLSKYLTGSWYVIPFSCIGDITDSKNIKRLH
jgi:hypothetical protein